MILAAGILAVAAAVMLIALFRRGHRISVRPGDDGRPRVRRHRHDRAVSGRYGGTPHVRRTGTPAPRKRQHPPLPWCDGWCDGHDHPPRKRVPRNPVTGEVIPHETELPGQVITADHRLKIALGIVLVLAVIILIAVH